MKNFLALCFLFYATLLFSQIEIKIEPLKNNDKNCKIRITIVNTSKLNYAIPLDNSGFKPFDNEIYWLDFETTEKLNKNLALELLIRPNVKEEYMEAFTRIPHPPDPDFINIDSLWTSMNKDFEDYEKEINSWKLDNEIEDFKKAEKNKYLINNMLFLKAGEEYSYNIQLQNTFSVEQFPFSPVSFYLIGPNQKYLINLRINITKDIKMFFTKKQLLKIKNNQLFSGIINSNNLLISFEDFSFE